MHPSFLSGDILQAVEFTCREQAARRLLSLGEHPVREAVVAQDALQQRRVERRQLVVVSDEQSAAGEHQRPNQFGAGRLGSLLDNDGIKARSLCHKAFDDP